MTFGVLFTNFITSEGEKKGKKNSIVVLSAMLNSVRGSRGLISHKNLAKYRSGNVSSTEINLK